MIILGIYKNTKTEKLYVFMCRSYEDPNTYQLYDIAGKIGLEIIKEKFNKYYEFIGKTWIGSKTQFLDYVEENDLT